MKKILSLLYVALLPLFASAYDAKIDGIYYNFYGNEAEVTSGDENDYDDDGYYTYYSGTVVIPASVTYDGKTYAVTSIGENSFSYCGGLTSITIPNSVTSIGDGAFSGCSGLTEVTLGNSVTIIGESAFAECEGLTSIIIPESVTSIGTWAFGDCENLILVNLKNDAIVSATKDDGSSMVSIFGDQVQTYILGNDLTSIGDYTFKDCSSLTSINIPENVTSIGDYTFYGCSSLNSINIPENMTSIGGWAFEGCSSLAEINIPTGITSIGDNTFLSCRSLISMKKLD